MFSFKLEDSRGEMRELADSILSVKFRDTSLPMELLPIIAPAALAHFKSGASTKDLTAQLRHNHDAEYDLEWTWLKSWRKRSQVHLDIWHAVAFALCVQCATEAFITWGVSGELAERQRCRQWLNKKAREHGKRAGVTSITDDFLENCQGKMLSGVRYFERVGDDIKFATFGEYLSGVPADSPIRELPRYHNPVGINSTLLRPKLPQKTRIYVTR